MASDGDERESIEVVGKYGRLLALGYKFIAVKQKVERRLRNPLFLLRHVGMVMDTQTAKEQPYGARTSRQQELLASLYAGQDKSDPSVLAAMSPLPLVHLASYYQETEDPNDEEIKQLKVLNDQASRNLQQGSPRDALTSVFAVGALAAKLVPKEVFEYFGWHIYTEYQVIVTLATILIAGYVANYIIPRLFAYRRRRAAAEVCEDVLRYLQ